MQSMKSLEIKNLDQLKKTGWKSESVKSELRRNFLRQLAKGDELYPGIIGYENTVIPEINISLISGHDMLYLGEKRTSEKPINARVDSVPR